MALRFFWSFDANSGTLGSQDYTVGSDSTASSVGSPSFSSSADATGGGYGLSCPSAAQGSYSFSTASGTVPVDRTVGSIGLWFKAVSNFIDNGDAMLRIQDADTSRRIELQAVTGNYLRLSIESTATGAQTITTSGTALSADTWYFVVLRWDQPNSLRSLEVYNSSGTLVDSASSSSGFTAPEQLVSSVGMIFGSVNATTPVVYYDNIIISNAYDADLVYNRNITDYTAYNEAGSVKYLKLSTAPGTGAAEKIYMTWAPAE